MNYITDDRKLALTAWKLAIQDDPALARAWKNWDWKGEDNKQLLINAASIFLTEQGQSIDDLLKSIKFAVVYQKKWTIANIARNLGSSEGRLNLKGETYSIEYRLADKGFMPDPDEGLAEAIMSYDFGD